MLGPRASPELKAHLIERMGLDKPLAWQVLLFFGDLLRGDMGTDVFTERAVSDIVFEQLPHTLELIFFSIVWSAALGVFLGVYAAVKRGSLADKITATLSVGCVAIPAFVVAILSLLLFSVHWRWFPAIGAGDPDDFADRLPHLVLPAFAIGLSWVGYVARLVRAAMLEIITEPYIRTAQAFGLPPGRVILVYALRSAILPVITIIGVGMGILLSQAGVYGNCLCPPRVGQADYRLHYHPQLSDCHGWCARLHGFVRLFDGGRRYRQRGAGCARPTAMRTAAAGAVAVLRRLSQRPIGLMSLCVVVVVVLSALLADWLVPYDPNALDIRARTQGPSAAHWLGTDQLGRDLLSRAIMGGRVALQVALPAVFCAMFLGMTLGMVAAFGPRWLDGAIMIFLDTVRSFPTVMFALAVVALVGPSLVTVVFVVIVTSIPPVWACRANSGAELAQQ